jgi:hypothetical protein
MDLFCVLQLIVQGHDYLKKQSNGDRNKKQR